VIWRFSSIVRLHVLCQEHLSGNIIETGSLVSIKSDQRGQHNAKINLHSFFIQLHKQIIWPIYPVELVVKDSIQQILRTQHHTLTLTSNMTLMEPWQQTLWNVTILTFLSSTITFSTVPSHHLLRMVFTCHN